MARIGDSGGGTPGGSSNQVQYNNAGVFGGADVVWNPATNTLEIPTGHFYLALEAAVTLKDLELMPTLLV